MNLFPDGFQMWSKWIAVLGVIGIVYAAAVALRQRDLKFVIGYSSVSHMGFVLLGLATANALGVGGAVLQMFSHGVIAALLFAVAGRMIYRRTHTRDLDALSEMGLGRALPFAAFSFVIASAASMGIPGFSGFAAEITILLGAWKAYPMAVLITGAGMVLVAAFTLRALRKTFFSEPYRGVRIQQGRVPVDSGLERATEHLSWHYCTGKDRSLPAYVRHARGRTLSETAARPHPARCRDDALVEAHELTSNSLGWLRRRSVVTRHGACRFGHRPCHARERRGFVSR